MLRTCSKQTASQNIPTITTKEYYRRVKSLPLIDNFISQLESTFSLDFNGMLLLEGLIPVMNASFDANVIVKVSER